MKNKIMIEITNCCENCNFHEKCLEEDCVLWEIEQIVINDDEEN